MGESEYLMMARRIERLEKQVNDLTTFLANFVEITGKTIDNTRNELINEFEPLKCEIKGNKEITIEKE